MAIFDNVYSANNVTDAGGGTGFPLPEQAGIPSFDGGAPAGPPLPAPVASPPVGPQVDPRLAMVLEALKPKPEPPAGQQILSKLLPAIAQAVANTQGSGGAFAEGYDRSRQHQAQIEAQRALGEQRRDMAQYRLAEILHQQQMEQAQIKRMELAQKKYDEAAQKETERKARQARLDVWKNAREGIMNHVNSLIDAGQGEAAANYMKGAHVGRDEEGNPYTVSDLVSQFEATDPETGKILGPKTEKQQKAGTQEEWVSNALEIAKKNNGGRPLTTEEIQKQTASALMQYKQLSKNPEDQDLARQLKQLQINTSMLHNNILAQQAREMAAAQGEIRPGTKEWRTAQDVAFGVLSYSDLARQYAFQRSGREMMRKIYDQARQINPDFSPALYEQGAKFAASPGARRSLAAISNVEAGLPSMVEASNAAKRSNIKALNEHFIIPGGAQIGEKSYSDLQAAHIAFADEIALALGIGTASDLKTKMGLDLANPALSPEAYESVLKNQLLPFLERRKASLYGQMGPYGGASGARDMINRSGKPNTEIPSEAKPGKQPGSSKFIVTVE